MDSPKEMFASRNVVTKYAKRARERQGKIIEGKMMGGMGSEGTVLHAATNKTPSRAAPNSEVLKGRNISAQGKLGTSAALGSDPKDEFALKGEWHLLSA